MVAAAGAGLNPIPHKRLDASSLTKAIDVFLIDEARLAVQSLSSKMATECGVNAVVQSFHANLPLGNMQCKILPKAVASFIHRKSSIRLSQLAARILIEKRVIKHSDVKNYKSNPLHIQNIRWDPVTSTASACFGVLADIGVAATNMVADPYVEFKNFRSKSSSSDADGMAVAGKIAGGVAKNAGRLVIAFYKGVIVYFPLATTEGFRNVPKLYGEAVKDYGQTQESGKNQGTLGYVKGFGKGMVGFVSKTSAAAVGIVAYPGDGICKSIKF
ncbi:hypothetical protein BKA66DRAFT_575527 [Pyrenochaeta sp. MPI-SDFR-AT-0127]|nr:hypothetical protein BKA66DRAFT_575527 [Pyrenochaeta sp. MPI-SDFR-AT-0127]